MTSYDHSIGKAWQDSDWDYVWSEVVHVFDKACGTVGYPSGGYCPFRIAPGYETSVFDLDDGSYEYGKCREIGIFIVNVNYATEAFFTQSSLWKDDVLLYAGDVDEIDSPKDYDYEYWVCVDFKTIFGWDTDEVTENGTYCIKREFSHFADMRNPYQTEVQYFTVKNVPTDTQPTPPPPTEGTFRIQVLDISDESPVKDAWVKVGDEVKYSDSGGYTGFYTRKFGTTQYVEIIKFGYDNYYDDWGFPDYVDGHTVKQKITPTGYIPIDVGLFDTVGAFFDDWSGYFHKLADDFKDTWLIGGLVFDTLWLIGNTAFDIGHQFHLLQDWKDSLDTQVIAFLDATGILALVSSTYDIVTHTWTEVETLVASVEAALPTWFPTSLTDLETLITDTIASAWSLFGDTASDIVTKGKSTILGWFPYDITDAQALLTWIGIEAGDVITTILDTPKDMFAWIQGEIEDTYALLMYSTSKWVEELGRWIAYAYFEGGEVWDDLKVTFEPLVSELWEGFGKSAEDFVTWIEPYLPSLPEWIPTTLTDLIALIENTVSDAFESILDKVFKE